MWSEIIKWPKSMQAVTKQCWIQNIFFFSDLRTLLFLILLLGGFDLRVLL